MSGAAVERFEAWWAEKQRTEFRHAFADAPDLHGGDREKRWGAAYQDKERVAYLASHDAAIAALTAELQQCREALMAVLDEARNCGDSTAGMSSGLDHIIDIVADAIKGRT